MKSLKPIALAACISLAAGLPVQAFADDLPSREEMWRVIQAQQKEIQALKEMVGQASQKVEAAAQQVAEAAEKADAAAEKAGKSMLGGLPEGVTISGAVEIEASQGNDYTDLNTSDITLATVELGIDAAVNEWTAARVLFKYEEGENSGHVFVDEGFITIGNTEKFPLYATVGKQYAPFVKLDSNMISDPLTKTVGEISETAVLAGLDWNGLYLQGYVFNGDTNANGRDDIINQGGVTLGYARETESGISYDFGAGWINNIADVDGMVLTSAATLNSYVPGYSVHGTVGYGGFQFIAEYVSAADPFDETQVSWAPDAVNGAEPSAYHAELAYNFELFGKATTAAIGYQGSDEALALSLPEQRLIAAITAEIFTNTTLGVEYYRDEDYKVSDGGTGENQHTGTMKLAIGF